MALEDLTGVSKFIDALVASNPGSDDFADFGDDHIRGIKNVLLNTFPNIDGAVTATPAELNKLHLVQAFMGTFLQAASTLAARQAINASFPGEIRLYAGASAPTDWLICDGTAGLDSIGDVSLAPLYAVIGTTYGGTGPSNFALPDFRGRSPIGVGTGDAGAATTWTRGEKGGRETVTLSLSEIPGHSHSIAQHSHNYGGTQAQGLGGGNLILATSGTTYTTSVDGPTSTGSAGSGASHTNMGPVLGMNFIIAK